MARAAPTSSARREGAGWGFIDMCLLYITLSYFRVTKAVKYGKAQTFDRPPRKRAIDLRVMAGVLFGQRYMETLYDAIGGGESERDADGAGGRLDRRGGRVSFRIVLGARWP